HSEARKAAILKAALDAVVTIDGDGRVVEWNPAAERIFGLGRDEARGRDVADLFIPPGLHEAHRRGMAHHLATGEAAILNRRTELRACGPDGPGFTIERATTRTADEPPLFTAHIRDLSERKRTEEALRATEQRFAMFMQHLPGLAWIKDLKGRYVYANDAAV